MKLASVTTTLGLTAVAAFAHINANAQSVTRPKDPGNTSSPSEPNSGPQAMGALRAADAERRRAYMVGIAQAFAKEEIDGSWASSAASRVNYAMDGDEALKAIARKVECRHQTCR